ncbi:MAG: twitching motility protein PilT [Planctomycetaceae bacterium]|nr:twitching motility protein PilT [Planctomycetaceae bacterium]
MAFRLLDTNIVSHILNRHTLASAYQPHLTGYDLAISFQTHAELFEGANLAGWGATRRSGLQSLLATLTLLDGTADVALRWAEIRVARRSQPIGVADCWIAATALTYGLELVTHNAADFQNIPGLTIITEVP